MKKATKRTLTREDWIFLKDGECPPDELQYCYEYEMAREAVIGGYVKCRRQPKWKWQDSIQVLRYFPEWPKSAWLAIKPELRKKRLAEYHADVAAAITERRKRGDYPHPVEGKVERLRDEQGNYQCRQTYFRTLDFANFDEGLATTYFVHRVNWELNNKELLRRFENWLKDGRKRIEGHRNEPLQGIDCRRDTTAKDRLNRLAVLRLDEAYGEKNLGEIQRLIKAELGYSIYSDSTPWKRAKEQAIEVDRFLFLLPTPFSEESTLVRI